MSSSASDDHGSMLSIVNGLAVPRMVTQERVDQLKTLKLYQDDVFIITPLGSGTTWMQQIVRLIRSKGEQDGQIISDAIPWLEASSGVAFGRAETDGYATNVILKDMPRPRAFKTHFPYELSACGLPDKTPCKYIYVVRNRKDAMVSMYCKLRQAYFPNLEWNFYYTNYEKYAYYGDYFDHVLSWWSHRNDENVLFLKYEDMKKDLPGNVAKVALYLGVDLPSNIVTKIADMTTFEKMKRDDSVNYSWDKVFVQDGNPMWLRKGVVGDWKNFFTAEQSAEVDALYAEKFKDPNLKFDFE